MALAQLARRGRSASAAAPRPRAGRRARRGAAPPPARSTAIGSTADSPFAAPTRASARSAAPRPTASGAGRSARWRAPAASQSSGRRPSGSCTRHLGRTSRSRSRAGCPRSRSEWTRERSAAVSPKPAVHREDGLRRPAPTAPPPPSPGRCARAPSLASSAPCAGSTRSRSSCAWPSVAAPGRGGPVRVRRERAGQRHRVGDEAVERLGAEVAGRDARRSGRPRRAPARARAWSPRSPSRACRRATPPRRGAPRAGRGRRLAARPSSPGELRRAPRGPSASQVHGRLH